MHVVDLVRGHLKALDYLSDQPTLAMQNLGTGHSALEVVTAFEVANKVPISYEMIERRPGDAATSSPDPSNANRELGWKAEYDLARMCQDVWRWESRNPNGYG